MKFIQKGRVSELFDLGNGKFLKLYNGWVSAERVAYEYMATNTAFEAGIPCARALEVIEKDYRKGIVFEFVAGAQLRQHIRSKPWNIRQYGIQMARLHARVHALQAGGLNNQKAQVKVAMEASYSMLKPYWNKIMDAMELLPDERTGLCHGDFSVENIIVSPNGLLLVDWADASTGDPASDVARAWILMHTPYMDAKLPFWATFAKRWLFHSYLEEYLSISGISKARCMAWQVPMAAARLKENVPNEKEWLLHLIGK